MNNSVLFAYCYWYHSEDSIICGAFFCGCIEDGIKINFVVLLKLLVCLLAYF